jgi:hypothetical protein
MCPGSYTHPHSPTRTPHQHKASMETRVKSSVLLLMGAKSSVLSLMGTKSSVLLVLCTLAVELRNGGRHPFGDCTLRMELVRMGHPHSSSLADLPIFAV